MGTHDTSRLSVLSALGLLVAGCFDVHDVDPGPYVLDDFEDGDLVPADPAFGAWEPFTFPDTNKMFTFDHGDGFDGSQYALYVDFTVVDKPNGVQEGGGAGLLSNLVKTAKPVDFTRYREFDFSVSLASGDPPLSKDAELRVELGCRTASAEDGSMPGTLFVTRGASYDVNWQSKRFTLANFGLSPTINTPIRGGPEACLSRVDSIKFKVTGDVPDGQTGRGILRIDKVMLR